MSHDSDLSFEWKAKSKHGKGILITRCNGSGAIFTDVINGPAAEERRMYIDTVKRKLPGVNREDIEQALERFAAESMLGDDGDERENPSALQQVARLADGAELFHAGETPYATVQISDGADSSYHLETYPIASMQFARWLAARHFKVLRRPAPSAQVQDTIAALSGKAIHFCKEQPVAVRLAEHDGAIYLDLCDDQWRVVKITKAGWSIIKECPVKFLRKKGMSRLPIPFSGGKVDRLRPLLNAGPESSNNRWVLMVAWMLSTLHPKGPYPILIINGEHGSAKSTASKMLRKIVDDSKTVLRSLPRDERDLMIMASNGWVCAFDNLSGMGGWISDALCRLSTGGGFGTRMLHTDDTEILIDAKRPIILNGIDEDGFKEDLLDRSIQLMLPVINEYRDEADIWAEFELVAPEVLGALLDAASCAMANIDAVRLGDKAKKIRMTDFTKWIVAAEPALGWEKDTFVNAYLANRSDASAAALEQSVIGPPIVSLVDHCPDGEWSGSATELLMTLDERYCEERLQAQKEWPKSGHKMSALLRRLAPVLRKNGVDVVQGESRNKSRRAIKLRRIF